MRRDRPCLRQNVVDEAVSIACERDHQMLHLAVAIQRRRFRKRMSGAHRDDEIFLVERSPMEARRDVVEGNDRDVHGARLQLGEGDAPGALGRGFPRRRQQLTQADVDAGRALAQLGEQRRQQHGRSAVGSADREPARGRGWIERRGGRDDAPRARQNVGDRAGQFRRARRRHDALGRSQEQRIVEQPTQPAEPVADRRRRQVQPIRGAADVPLFQHRLEQDEEVEVGSGEINLIQHIAEIISLDSVDRRTAISGRTAKVRTQGGPHASLTAVSRRAAASARPPTRAPPRSAERTPRSCGETSTDIARWSRSRATSR